MSETGKSEQDKLKQSASGQAKADQAKTEPAKTEPGRAEAEPEKLERAKAVQAKTEQVKPEQSKVGLAEPEQAKTEQVKAGLAEPEQAKSEQAKTELKTKQAKAGLAEPEQAKSEQTKPEQAKAKQAKAGQAKPEQAKSEQAEPTPARAGRVEAQAKTDQSSQSVGEAAGDMARKATAAVKPVDQAQFRTQDLDAQEPLAELSPPPVRFSAKNLTTGAAGESDIPVQNTYDATASTDDDEEIMAARRAAIKSIRKLLEPKEIALSKDELSRASKQLKKVDPYNYEAWRLHADLLLTALRQLETRELQPDANFTILAIPLLEDDVRDAAEAALRQCAHFAGSIEKRIELVDEANRVRRLTWT